MVNFGDDTALLVQNPSIFVKLELVKWFCSYIAYFKGYVIYWNCKLDIYSLEFSSTLLCKECSASIQKSFENFFPRPSCEEHVYYSGDKAPYLLGPGIYFVTGFGSNVYDWLVVKGTKQLCHSINSVIFLDRISLHLHIITWFCNKVDNHILP